MNRREFSLDSFVEGFVDAVLIREGVTVVILDSKIPTELVPRDRDNITYFVGDSYQAGNTAPYNK